MNLLTTDKDIDILQLHSASHFRNASFLMDNRPIGHRAKILVTPKHSDSCHPTFRLSARLPGFCTDGKKAIARHWPAWRRWLMRTCTPSPSATCGGRLPATLCKPPDW